MYRPNLALIPHLLAQGYDISYIGTEKGIEREMISKVPEADYYAVKSGKLRRYFSWQQLHRPLSGHCGERFSRRT